MMLLACESNAYLMNELPSNLPPYTYVPGQTPHPFSDPQGHSYGLHEAGPFDLDERFHRGLVLFQNGYFWEAHEAWEQAWIVLGRKGEQANYIKGLIKLAAAGVKCLEENKAGAQRHLKRAQELLNASQASTVDRFADQLASHEELVKTIESMVSALTQCNEPN